VNFLMKPMRVFVIIFFVATFLIAAQPLSAVPTDPSIVTVKPNDYRLYVQDRLPDGTLGPETAYVARGVNWSPASPSTDPWAPDAFFNEFVNWYQTDIPLMAQMGINTVRVYHDFGTGPEAFDILDELYDNGIKVIVQVDSPYHGANADLTNVQTVVQAYKDHPAILMWGIGNEWDSNLYFIYSTLEEAAQFTETAAALIKSLDSNHPVTTVIGDVHTPQHSNPNLIHPLNYQTAPFWGGLFTEDIVDTLVPSVDVWGTNTYRASSFWELFRQWEAISEKPMYVSEFGTDSFKHSDQFNGMPDETFQAEVNRRLWDEIQFDLSAERIEGAAVGALAFEWNDEWWKNINDMIQTFSTGLNGGHPDGVNDEEYFGIVDIDRNQKELYDDYKNRFEMGYRAAELIESPTIRASSEGGSSGAAQFEIDFGMDDSKTVYLRPGGGDGGRGINLAVLDPNTGMRMEDYRHYDTYFFRNDPNRFDALSDYINLLPNGSIILFSLSDEGGFMDFPPYETMPLAGAETGFQILESLGSTQIRSVPFGGSWAMISVKGQGLLDEDSDASGASVTAETTLNLTLDALAGLRELPPTGSVLINSGDDSTNIAQVTLALTGDDLNDDLESMRFSTNGGNTWTAWEPFQTSKMITLPGPNGERSVSVELQDSELLVSHTFSDTIVLDTVPPTGSVVINNNDASTTSSDVTLTLTGNDPPQGDFNGDGLFNTDDVSLFIAALTQGTTVDPELGDFNGDGRFDLGDLSALSAALNDPSSTLNAASGLDAMRFSTDGGNAWTAWEPFATTKDITVPGTSGEKEVQYQLRDLAANVSTFSDVINLELSSFAKGRSVGTSDVNIMSGVLLPTDRGFTRNAHVAFRLSELDRDASTEEEPESDKPVVF